MNERLQIAEELLQEAVFASRERQATGASLMASKGAGCGLGERAEVVLDLSARGNELLERLWSSPPATPDRERIGRTLSEWIERQDQLDRRRNHFLKDFRQRHGFERTAYSPDLTRAFEEGLANINAQETAERTAAARSLLGGTPP